MREADYEQLRQGVPAWNAYVHARRESDQSWKGELSGAQLFGADLKDANLFNADLSGADLNDADLRGATLSGADLNDATLIGSTLSDATLFGADLTGADLTGAAFIRANLTSTALTGADLAGVWLGWTVLTDLDVAELCSTADLVHVGPSFIDARTVMRSWDHSRFKEFMAACGVPWIFSEYMVDCARAETADDLRALMQSTFISYGQPDDAFARRLYESLTSKRITVFYFPETARWGERISSEVHKQLNNYDRIILLCSEASLNRPGVRNEIQETLDREARNGGAAYLLPIALDGYLFDDGGWESVEPELTRRVRARIVGDFRRAQSDPAEYDKALTRLIDVLKKTKP